MVEMGASVQVYAAAPFVDLREAVAGHGELAGVQILEVLRRTKLARLGKGVAADVVILDEVLFQGVGEVDERGAAVGKFGVAAGALGGQLNGSQEREAGAAEVVAGIGMEKLIALGRQKSQLVQIQVPRRKISFR